MLYYEKFSLCLFSHCLSFSHFLSFFDSWSFLKLLIFSNLERIFPYHSSVSFTINIYKPLFKNYKWYYILNLDAGWATSMIWGVQLWPRRAQGAQRSAHRRRALHPSITLLRVVSSPCPCSVGLRLPRAFLPPLLSPTQQGAPSISAQPRYATTSVPGTDRSWTSRRVTLSRSLTRRGNKAGGEGRSTAGWVRAQLGTPSNLALLTLHWNCGLQEVGSGSRGGLPWLRRGKGVGISFIGATCIYFLSTSYVPGTLLGAEETKMSTVQSLLLWHPVYWRGQACNQAVTVLSGQNCDGESQAAWAPKGTLTHPRSRSGHLIAEQADCWGFCAYLVHCSITSAWNGAWHMVGAQQTLNAWRGRGGINLLFLLYSLACLNSDCQTLLKISQKSLFLPDFYFCLTKAESLLYFICWWVPSL